MGNGAKTLPAPPLAGVLPPRRGSLNRQRHPYQRLNHRSSACGSQAPLESTPRPRTRRDAFLVPPPLPQRVRESPAVAAQLSISPARYHLSRSGYFTQQGDIMPLASRHHWTAPPVYRPSFPRCFHAVHLPAADSRAIAFATTADRLRSPVIDGTHPAFAGQTECAGASQTCVPGNAVGVCGRINLSPGAETGSRKAAARQAARGPCRIAVISRSYPAPGRREAGRSGRVARLSAL